MFQTKATITGVIGAIALVVALFSPTKEITNADSLVGFASGQNVQTQTVQTNKGAISLLFIAAIGSAVWTVTGNDDKAELVAVPSALSNRPVPDPSPTTPASDPVTAQAAPIEGDNLDDFWEQDVEFSTLAEQFDFETRQSLLRDALIAHEGGWMLRLLYWPVLLVIGRPGSAKSSFAASLGITREMLNPDIRLTVVTDPNSHLKLEQGIWQMPWQLKGSRDNWSEIGSAISDMYLRFADSVAANNVSSIYDEVTTYKGHVDKSQLGGFLSQVTSKARACAEYITIVAHNDTLKALGGETGESQLKDDMAQLNLGSKATVVGRMVPTGKGSIEGLDVDEKNNPISQSITLPRWFDPAILSELFPEVYPIPDDGSAAVSESNKSGKTYQFQASAEPPANRPITDDGKALTIRAARTSAASLLAERIQVDLGVSVSVGDILAAAESSSNGASNTHVIKEILGMKGDRYSMGKTILEMIKQTFITEE